MSTTELQQPEPTDSTSERAGLWSKKPSLPAGVSFIASLLVTHLVVLALMAQVGPGRSAAVSLVGTSVAAGAGLCLLGRLSLGRLLGRKALVILLAAFLARLAIGIVHYLVVMDPSYFDHSSVYRFLHDYEFMHQSMITVSRWWSEHGVFAGFPPGYKANNLNPHLYGYNGLVYYLSGINVLNLAPWNSLHACYTAVIIAFLALRSGATQRQAITALTIAAFEPFGFISSFVWRDIVGQSIMAFGFLLVVLSSDRLWSLSLCAPLAGFLSHMQRKPYAVAVAVLAYFLYLGRRTISTTRLAVTAAATVPLVLLAVNSGIVGAVSEASLGLYRSSTAFGYGPASLPELPIRFVRALLGPWPWHQIFFVSNTQYIVPDFLQAVLNVAVFVIAAPLVRLQWRETKSIDPGVVFASVLFLIAMLSAGIHLPYAAIGTVFLLPVACRAPRHRLVTTIFVVLELFLLGNVVYWALGFTGANISGV